MLRLARLKIDARHVPLGWSDSLERYAPPDDVDRDLGVVFVGRMNGRRKQVLVALRKRGVPVYHANADALLFGDGLRDVLRRARIVLSLAYFGDADEWKATRYLPSIAAGAVVVAEAGGARLEREAWREAVVFVEGVDAMVDVVKFYLRNETARAERARRAAAVLKARSASRRRCAGPSRTSCSGRAGSGGRPTWGCGGLAVARGLCQGGALVACNVCVFSSCSHISTGAQRTHRGGRWGREQK